jgi:DNA-binding response OmpR family regulator
MQQKGQVQMGFSMVSAKTIMLAFFAFSASASQLSYADETEICKQYRAEGGAIPILMLTSKTDVTDKVSGLESGADDYLTKPFAMPELHARHGASITKVLAPRAFEKKLAYDENDCQAQPCFGLLQR